MGRNSGRGGAIPCNNRLTICPGVKFSVILYGRNTGPVDLASGQVP